MRDLVLVLSVLLMGTISRVHAQADTTEAMLIRLESAKWGNPPGALSFEQFTALYADDFVSVEYGAQIPPVGVQRKSKQEVFSGPPLPSAKFELTEWKTIHPSADTIILSYYVRGISFKWKAYATSVWARRDRKWLTVFYQASTAQ